MKQVGSHPPSHQKERGKETPNTPQKINKTFFKESSIQFTRENQTRNDFFNHLNLRLLPKGFYVLN